MRFTTLAILAALLLSGCDNTKPGHAMAPDDMVSKRAECTRRGLSFTYWTNEAGDVVKIACRP